MRIITKLGLYRIIERQDEYADLENLKGDCYNPEVNSDIDIDKLKKEEVDFEDLVNREGVYGYELQRWNAEVDKGWEHVDSCWGFVGQYSESDETFKHYIVDEMKKAIELKLVYGHRE